MKAPSMHAVNMVRRIRDAQARALARKSPAEVIAYYRAAGVAATRVSYSARPSTCRLTRRCSRRAAAKSAKTKPPRPNGSRLNAAPLSGYRAARTASSSGNSTMPS